MGDQIRGRAAGPYMWRQAELWAATGHRAFALAAPASQRGAAALCFQVGRGRLVCCSCSSLTTYYDQGHFTFQSIFLLTVI